MIIVKVIGGLGNQMFQYAFYESLKDYYKNVKLDIFDFEGYNLHNGYELESMFKINASYSSKEDSNSFKLYDSTFISKIIKKVPVFKNFTNKYYFRENQLSYNPEVFKLKSRNIYFDGYWQSEKYFNYKQDFIRNKLTLKKKLEGRNLKLLNYIQNTQSVSIHIRRGDYLISKRNIERYGDICNLPYYNKAISIIQSKISNPKFVIFSDDINWTKKNLKVEDGIYVDWNQNINSSLDMILMSKCKNNIIANSTFSWWGAWLNNNSNKIIITPKKWNNDKNTKDIVPNEWIKI